MTSTQYKGFTYSEKYTDSKYEYRHVTIPKEKVKELPVEGLMSEEEWRELGIQQSVGWIHYHRHLPEPHIVLFRRPLSEPLVELQSASTNNQVLLES